MRAVIGGLAVPALVLLLCVSAAATSVGTDIYDDGTYKTYTYTLSSDEMAGDGQPDYITSFHVYAPVNVSLVSGWCDNLYWTFDCIFDEEISAADMYWQFDTTQGRGLGHDSQSFCIRTSSSVPSTANYVLEGYLGNWGFESEAWAGWGVFVMLPSVQAPNEMTASIPEPGSAMVVLSGLCALALLRRRG